MNYNESLELFGWFKANYSSISKMTKDDARMWATSWSSAFQDVPFELVVRACKRCQIDSKFAPTISETSDALRKLLIEVESKLFDDDAKRHENDLIRDLNQRQRVELLCHPVKITWNDEPQPTLTSKQRQWLEKIRDILNAHFNCQQDLIDSMLGMTEMRCIDD